MYEVQYAFTGVLATCPVNDFAASPNGHIPAERSESFQAPRRHNSKRQIGPFGKLMFGELFKGIPRGRL